MNEIIVNEFILPKLEIRDYEILKKAIEEDNEKYNGYIVTEQTLEADTKKRIELRKQAKAIDEKRKEIEKQISAPIKQFKLDCDILKNMYENSADILDTQIKVYENKTKEKKKLQINKIFNELIGKEAISNLINLDMLFDERYLNKTYDLEDVEKDLFNKIKKIVNDLQAIKDLNSEYEVSLTNSYLKNFDLSSIIAENKKLQELKKETVKVEEKQEEIKEEKVQKMLSTKVEVENIDPVKTYTLRITGELSKQKKLKEFLELNNMKYERIDISE